MIFTLLEQSIFSPLLLLLLLGTGMLQCVVVRSDESTGGGHVQEYMIVGVSGGLQAGFPDHPNLDYHPGQDDEVQAVFLGRALVRGYKSFLDVMEPDWRQYTPEPGQPLINCNVFPSGCYEHANQYWIYLVDARQFVTILMREPRFLSITPDLGLIDLTVRETSPVVKHIAQHEIARQGKADTSHIGFPIVTAAWFNPTSHVESPVLYTMEDGTEVTNFAQSLATWAGVIFKDSCNATGHQIDGDDLDSESFAFLAPDAQDAFWKAIRKAVRSAEDNRPTSTNIGPPFRCQGKKARFGVSKSMAQVNYPFSPLEFAAMLAKGVFH